MQRQYEVFTAFTPTAIAVTPTLLQNTCVLHARNFTITSLLRHEFICFSYMNLCANRFIIRFNKMGSN
jgi:hypothetical protein